MANWADDKTTIDKMKLFRLTLLTLSVFIFNKCDFKKVKSDSQVIADKADSTQAKTTDTNTTPEDFDVFYERFHIDSSFQMSRLRFPLKGTDEFAKEWTPKNWALLKGKIFDVDTAMFKVDFKKTDTEFMQKAWINSSGFMTECKFELIEGKWYLVYRLEFNS